MNAISVRLLNVNGELAESIPSADEWDLDGRFDLDPKIFRDEVYVFGLGINGCEARILDEPIFRTFFETQVYADER